MTDWPRGGYAAGSTPASELKPPPSNMVSKSSLPATYTAAEVKVLTETASKVAYALGRKDAGEEIAEAAEEAADDLDLPIMPEWLDQRSWFKGQLHAIAAKAYEVASQPSPDATTAGAEAPGYSDLPQDSRAGREAL